MSSWSDKIKKEIPHGEKVVFLIVMFYFALHLVFYATSISFDISPDEYDHLQRSLNYQNYASLVLPDTPQTAHLEIDSSFPYLYHLLLGKLFFLKPAGVSLVLFARFINIVLSLLTVFFGYRLMLLLTRDKWISLLGLIVLTNIPMFSFLSAFTTSDNLVNLLSVLCFYELGLFMTRKEPHHLFLFLIFGLSGCLTKISFLPLFAILFLILFIDNAKKQNRLDWKNFLSLPSKNFLWIGAFALIILLALLNGWFYGQNFVRYKTLTPGCTQLFSLDQCLQRVAFQTQRALNAHIRTLDPRQMLSPFEYFYYWRAVAMKGIFGIFGHRLMFRPTIELLPYSLLLIACFACIIRRFKPGQNMLLAYFLYATLAYALILFFRFSYPVYRQIGLIEGSIHGRYLFPVLVPAITGCLYYLLKDVNKTVFWILFIGIAILFIWGDLPYFLVHAKKAWYLKNGIESLPLVQPLL